MIIIICKFLISYDLIGHLGHMFKDNYLYGKKTSYGQLLSFFLHIPRL